MNRYLKLYFGIFLLMYSNVLTAQNLEEISLKKGLVLGGSLNISSVGYATSLPQNRRENFSWFASGNLNINLFGYQAPFSFSFSNTQRQFAQPFNRLTFNPQYKWVKTYLGYNSMTLSPYTLSGVVFLGGGVELTPGKWRIAAMYGRLRKAVPFDPIDSTRSVNASFKRMGYGIKIGADHKNTSWDISLFTAKDDPNSIPFVPIESDLTPQQNVASSIHLRQNIIAGFSIDFEYGLSVMNQNINADPQDDTLNAPVRNSNFLQSILPENTTFRYFDAFNGSLAYQGKGYGIQLKYERISPEYETLGAYFFNNDMENITIAPQVQLFQGKLNLGANFGIQRNNLDQSRNATTKRFVSSVQANYLPNASWNFAVNYSNFSTFTNLRPQVDPFFQDDLDSLNFFQVNNTLNTSISYLFGNKTVRQAIITNLTYQRANSQSETEGGDQLDNFYSGTLGYTLTQAQQGRSLGFNFQYNLNQIALISNVFYGPSLTYSQSLLKKALRLNLSTTYNHSTTTGQSSNDVINTRLGLSFRPSKTTSKGAKTQGKSQEHQFNLGLNLVNRLKSTPQQPKFTEFTATLRYNYNF